MELPAELAIESWILYGLGVVVVVCRLLSRRIKLGKWRDLMIDDYLMVFALVRPSPAARRAGPSLLVVSRAPSSRRRV